MKNLSTAYSRDSPDRSVSKNSAERPYSNPETVASVLSRVGSRRNRAGGALPAFLRVGACNQMSSLRVANIKFGACSSQGCSPVRVAQKSPVGLLEGIALTVRNRGLSHIEVLALREGGGLSANLLETCLAVFKQMNSELCTQDEGFDKVMIANTRLADKLLLNRKHLGRSKINMFRYE